MYAMLLPGGPSWCTDSLVYRQAGEVTLHRIFVMLATATACLWTVRGPSWQCDCVEGAVHVGRPRGQRLKAG